MSGGSARTILFRVTPRNSRPAPRTRSPGWHRDPLLTMGTGASPPRLALPYARLHDRGEPMPAPAPHLSEIVEAVSISYNNLVYEMKARGEDVIVLSLGEAFFDIPL